MLSYDEKMTNKLNERIKGKSLLTFPEDYTVIDIETNGISPTQNDIIELSAIRVRKDKSIETFSKLVKPKTPVGKFISQLTGITNQILSNSPTIETVLPEYLNFINDDIILGHNVNFDINFIYDKCVKHFDKTFSNDFVDTLRIARKLKINSQNHKLQTLADFYEIHQGRMHRGLEDCRITFEVYKHLKTHANAKISEFM